MKSPLRFLAAGFAIAHTDDLIRTDMSTCWPAGLKHLLVEMGVFRTTRHLLNYPLTPACRKAIACALTREKESLLP